MRIKLGIPPQGFKRSKALQELEAAWGRQGDGSVEKARGEAEAAEAEADEANSPTGMAKAAAQKAGEITGITPTAKKIAAGIAPAVVPQEELPAVVEELAGGVDTPQPSVAGEFAETALDLPLISLGLSKGIAAALGKQLASDATALGKPLIQLLPKEITDALQAELKAPQMGNPLKGAGDKAKDALQRGVEGARAKITGVPTKVGEEKVTEDTLKVAREPITKDYEEKANLEGRTFKEGNFNEIKYHPTRREELVADSIRHLVEDGRVKGDALPFENITEIQLEVNRLNHGIKEMIAERDIPFQRGEFIKKLKKTKAESDIVFTTDPTLERTYDALVDEFLKNVPQNNASGLFEARQSFDKIPAVKKLLDGLKGSTGENLRRQAVLDIRRAANEYLGELLSSTQVSKAKRVLEPTEIKPLVERAKDFPKVEDFVRNQKAALQKRRNFTKPADWETSVEQDLEEIWQIANSELSGTAGDTMLNTFKKESHMLEVVANLAEKGRGMGGSTDVSRFIDQRPMLKYLIRQAIPFSAGAAIL